MHKLNERQEFDVFPRILLMKRCESECMSQPDEMPAILASLVIFAILVLIPSLFLIFDLGPGLTRLLGTLMLFAIVIAALWVAGARAKGEHITRVAQADLW